MIDNLKDLMDLVVLTDLADAADAVSSISDLVDAADFIDAADFMDAADAIDPFLDSDSLTMANGIDRFESSVDGMVRAEGGHEISFEASPDVDARNAAKSNLIDKLQSDYIYTSNLYTDNLWGGLDYDSGKKVYDAINKARDCNNISGDEYNKLVALLKKACHTQ
ncbi:MAG: hypothetical protein MJZ86_02110 [Bacteroidales bacterium]|nr:hypothetical protein [Bacteroidales bacterium]